MLRSSGDGLPDSIRGRGGKGKGKGKASESSGRFGKGNHTSGDNSQVDEVKGSASDAPSGLIVDAYGDVYGADGAFIGSTDDGGPCGDPAGTVDEANLVR